MIITQIGTNTGSWIENGEIKFDSCLKFVKDNEKSVEFIHLIEPMIECFPKIENSYKFIKNKKLYNIAITPDKNLKEIDIYYPKNNELSAHTSCNQNHLIVHGHGENIQSRKIKSYTLNSFFELNSIERCDILFVDTEGLDCLILLDYDFEKYKTNYIEFEIIHSDGPFTKSVNAEKCIDRLKNAGFTVKNDQNDYLNVIATR